MSVSAVAHRERGSTSVLVAGAVGVTVMVLSAVLVVVSAVRDVHRVHAAADLAALAAAGGSAGSGGPDCRAAAAVADANGARLTRCSAEPDGSVVVVASRRARWPRQWHLPRTISARARAGVVDDGGTGRPAVPTSGHPVSTGPLP